MVSIKVKSNRDGTAESQTVIPGIVNSVNGSIAGATSGFLTTPLDVLKTRQMTFQTENQSKNLSTNILRDLKTILTEEGVSGLFRGATVRMGYLTVGGFAFFGMYENTKRLL